MTRKEIEEQLARIEKMKAEYEKLIELENDLRAAIKNADGIPDAPEFSDSERVFFVNSDLDTDGYTFLADPKPGTLPFNSFHTLEVASEFRDICLWNAMLLHCRHYLCPDYTPNWETDDDKYTVYLNTAYEKPRFEVDFAGHQSRNYNCVYFPSIDTAQKAADWMNEHWGYGG